MANPTNSFRPGRLDLFEQLLRLFPTGRMVDLGTGHGRFAIRAADLGWDATGVDARNERWPDDQRVTWVQEDVRTHDLDNYDVIACLGLFYHLTCEDQLSFLARAAGRPVILDTHLDHGEHKHKVTRRLIQGDGYEGVLYTEPGATTSSWENASSFWPTLPSFQRMLAENGYGTVLTVDPWHAPDRTFFVALPNPAAT